MDIYEGRGAMYFFSKAKDAGVVDVDEYDDDDHVDDNEAQCAGSFQNADKSAASGKSVSTTEPLPSMSSSILVPA